MATSNNLAIAIEIEQETQDRLTRLADARQHTPHRIINEAILQYLDREEKRETFRQDTLNAWEGYQTTGMHVNAEEVSAWLETWGQENELFPPECHK